MQKIFNENGFHIPYPADWELEEDAEKNGETIYLYPPGESGFWSLSRFPTNETPEELVKTAKDTILAEYPEGESAPVRQTCGTHVLTGFDVDFIFLDIPCTAIIRAMQHSEYTYLIFAQYHDLIEANQTVDFSEITRRWAECLNHV